MRVTNKQLLPVYDKPMIYYLPSILLIAEMKDILIIHIISTHADYTNFEILFGDEKQFGMRLMSTICAMNPTKIYNELDWLSET